MRRSGCCNNRRGGQLFTHVQTRGTVLVFCHGRGYCANNNIMAEGPGIIKELLKIDTGEEDVFCICPYTPRGGIASGHSSKVKVWNKDSSLHYEVLPPAHGDVTCVLTTPTHLFISVDSSLILYDHHDLATPTETCRYNSEEINQILINTSCDYLLSADDSGDVSVIDISAIATGGKSKLYKKCKRHHTNICSSVTFHPSKHWEMVSGGLDCQLVLWDYSRGRRLASLNMQGKGGAGYMVNPPMVHSVCGLGGNRPVIAAGLGNGSVYICHVSGSDINLTSTVQPHSNSVASVVCISNREEPFKLDSHAKSDKPSGDEEIYTDLVISGGNDGKVICSPVVKTTPKAATPSKTTSSNKAKGSSHKTPPTYKISEKPLMIHEHGSKVNWLTELPDWSPGKHVVGVADQTSNITLYFIEL